MSNTLSPTEIEAKLKAYAKRSNELKVESAREEERYNQIVKEKNELIDKIKTFAPDFDESKIDMYITELQNDVAQEVAKLDELLK